jgi:hypothetical protein
VTAPVVHVMVKTIVVVPANVPSGADKLPTPWVLSSGPSLPVYTIGSIQESILWHM